ncbi:hypothetical protein DERP_003181 [Dermatophagoides pteronyssinus]|uniref:Uncharacterized protein n=1 Tax=Dermatophagoides pteronyssinus TaxID=6956 RepID=A0ABQ8JJB8_DERPT|nr:hypothetical protein DERP_003181 [Dermatophagoides pteronyssinus]
MPDIFNDFSSYTLTCNIRHHHHHHQFKRCPEKKKFTQLSLIFVLYCCCPLIQNEIFHLNCSSPKSESNIIPTIYGDKNPAIKPNICVKPLITPTRFGAYSEIIVHSPPVKKP